MRLLMFVVGGTAGTIVLPLVSLIIILVITGGYVVAGSVGPVDWPEKLDVGSVAQVLAVIGYVGMLIGGFFGAYDAWWVRW